MHQLTNEENVTRNKYGFKLGVHQPTNKENGTQTRNVLDLLYTTQPTRKMGHKTRTG